MVQYAEDRSCITQFELGELFYLGKKESQDYEQATKWYRTAAINGSRRAQHRLGTMYARGHGIKQDYVKAYAWIKIAAFKNSRVARRKLSVLETKMSLNQLRRGRWLAQDYFDKLIASRKD